MQREDKKLIFSSDESFNRIMSNEVIPLEYFVQTRLTNSNVVLSYYISPRRREEHEGRVLLAFVTLRFIPIEFIMKTLDQIKTSSTYNAVDIIMVLKASNIIEPGLKDITAIKFSVYLEDYSREGISNLLFTKAWSTFNGTGEYSMFSVYVTHDGNLTFHNTIFPLHFIFTLRDKRPEETFLDVAKLKTSKKKKKFDGKEPVEIKYLAPITSYKIIQKMNEELKPLEYKRNALKQEEKRINERLSNIDQDFVDIFEVDEPYGPWGMRRGIYFVNQEEIDGINKRKDEIRQELEQVEEEIKPLETELNENLNLEEKYIYELQSQKNAASRRIQMLKSKLVPLESLLKQKLAEEIDVINALSKEEEVLDLKEDEYFANNVQRLADLGRDIDHLRNEIKPLQDELNENLNLEEAYDLRIKDVKGDDKSNVGSFVNLPEIISTKCRKCILNIANNTDKRCFYYTVNAWYMFKNNIEIRDMKNLNRPSNFKETFFNWEGINIDEFKLSHVKQFCLNNNIGIVLWEIVGSELVKILNMNEYQTIIPLILYKKHIMLIKNVDKFFNIVADQLHLKNVFICDKCLSFYSCRQNILEKHREYECKNRTEFKVMKKQYKMPYNTHINFKNYLNRIKCRYIMVADYEAMLPKTYVDELIANSYKINIHKPFMIGYALTIEDTLDCYGSFKGEDCTSQFLSLIDEITVRINKEKEVFSLSKSKVLFNNGDVLCTLCNLKISNGTAIINPMLDNSVVHESCYDLISDKVFSLKIIFHNFKNYDAHFLIDEVFKRKKNIFTIPKTKEKYTTIQYIDNTINVKFIDSYAFLQGSLDSLSKRLKNRKYYKGNDIKMTFPYEYIDSYDKLNEPELPSDEAKWYSSIKKCSPSRDEIEASIKYFKDKNFTSIYDYATEYMMTDVFLLLEIIYDFKTTSFNTYGIDPLHYYTLPGYAWDVTLNVIDVNLCLLKDEKIIDILLENIRGGISSVSRRKWLKEDENNSIFYFDANNLYGWAMSQSLPYDDFMFIECENPIDLILFYDINDEYGYILTVDLEYPQRLYEYHNELPFLPERINDRLCLSLENKKMYTSHILNIKQAMEEGLVLDKVWSIIRYKQSKWLEKYIAMNTSLRTNSTSDSDKNFYKLMNNAVFGKTMQNPLKECKYIPVGISDEDKKKEMEKKKAFKSVEQWTDNLLLYEMDKVPVMDKPIYIGFVILELSKWKMYNTFYNGIKRKWPSSTLAYMDTDSFVLNIPMKRSEIDFIGVEDYFDLSVYPQDSKWYNPSNKGVLGKLKDEHPKEYIKEFICIRSKMYGMTTSNDTFIYKCKGISKSTILTMDDLKKNLKDSLALYTEQVNIKSVRHEVGTWITNKKTLPNDQDVKRVNIYKDDEIEEHKRYLTNSIGFI